MNEHEEYVYCTHCKHFSCTEDSLFCSYSEECYFYDTEDSRPKYMRPCFEEDETIKEDFYRIKI